ncbi:MAG: fatty acid desaturase [Candidatus Binataceae bacterium]
MPYAEHGLRSGTAARLLAAKSPERIEAPPWEWPWWRTTRHDFAVFAWIILIHGTALVGLVLYPLPGWRVLAGALALAWIGGLGTTICYHRALAHRSLKLTRWARTLLIFFAMFNGSGTPLTWTAGHRLHHANADTPDDISSPIWGGFWWAHLRWLWQADAPSIERYCPELDRTEYRIWRRLQGPILALSYFGGLYFGIAAFFWLGAIRLVFSLHAQCFVNSVCHSEPGVAVGEDSSRNVHWLGAMQFFQGENWHRNHHARPGSARLGWTWWQPDIGYVVICLLEKISSASEVRRPRGMV